MYIMSFSALPDEVIHEICECFGLRTLLRARAVTHQLKTLATQRLSTEVVRCAACSLPLCLHRDMRLPVQPGASACFDAVVGGTCKGSLRFEDGESACVDVDGTYQNNVLLSHRLEGETQIRLAPLVTAPSRPLLLQVRTAVQLALCSEDGGESSATALDQQRRSKQQLSGFRVQNASCPRCALHLGMVVREAAFSGGVDEGKLVESAVCPA